MSSRPWMPLYIADYLADTAHLSTTEHGAYLLLIMHYWTKGKLPDDEESIRRVTRLNSRQWSQSRDVLRSLFGDDWRHKRIDSELGKAIEKSKVNSANAKRRQSERTANAERTHTHARASSQSQPQKDTELRSAPPAASAPVYTDSRHELWGEGVPILTALGVKDRDVRSNIGRWLKTMNDDAQAVLGAIQRARDHRIVDPIPWITQALKGNGNGNTTGFTRNTGAAGAQQSGSAAIVAGVAAASERRAREREQRELSENPAPARQPDFGFGRTGNR